MKKARVLHIIRPAAGGMKQHLEDLVAGLNGKEFMISVAGPGDSDGDDIKRVIEALGASYYPVRITGPLRPAQDFRCVLELYGLIKRERFDIVHCHGSKAGLVGRMAAWLAGAPVIIVTIHNFVVYEEVPLFKRLLFTRGEEFLGRKTTGIITVSRALKTEMAKKFGIPEDKVAAIYNGIDLERFRVEKNLAGLRKDYGIGEDIPIVGTVARMAPQKGLRYFVEAAAMLVKEGCTGIFFIVGDGPLRPELEVQADRLGLKGRLIFTGYQSDIVSFLKMFDIFVIPSIAEGLSITTIEAMAAGKPVIASRVGGLPELVKHEQNGLLVPPRDAGALTRAIKYLIRQPELCKNMGQTGNNMVIKEFTKKTMIAKTAEFYRKCLTDYRR